MKYFHVFLRFIIIILLLNIKNTQAAIGIINLRLLIEQAPQAIVKTQIIENEFKIRKQRLIALQKKNRC